MSPDLTQLATDLSRRALITAVELALPILLVGLVVGLLISLFQALTQLQEQTLTFIPKILAVGAALFLLLPWMMALITEFARDMFHSMHRFWIG